MNTPTSHPAPQRVAVTGADGFIGRVLTRRLLEGALGPLEQLTLVDMNFKDTIPHPAVRQITGSIAEPAIIKAALTGGVDALFHLASVPGGAAEIDYDLGRRVNLMATQNLLEALRGGETRPRVVFASSVAVYGAELPPTMDETTLPAPALSYGAHKLIGEILIADASRLGWIEGCSLRLPGVVARPPGPSGLISAFMSEIFWRLQKGEAVTLPVSPGATAWWISVHTCVDNLLHAATTNPHQLAPHRSYCTPVLRLTMSELANALTQRFGPNRKSLITYQPNPKIERLFGAYPPLATPHAETLGFRHDGDVQTLITRAIGP